MPHDHDHHDHDHHDHDHHDHHDHAPTSNNRAFGIGIALNVGFVAIESIYGVLAHSTALLADAAHNLSDVLGLVMAWAAATLARRPASSVRTYGFRRSTILAALANALLLIAAVGAVAWEAIGRLRVPAEAQASTMMWVAAAGVVVNAVSAFFFHERGGHGHAHGAGDMNLRGAFLHLLADATVSAGVVIAGLVLMQTGWTWVDPVTSLIVSVVILFGTWSLLRDALHLALDGVPKHIALDKVRAYLAALPEVNSVHDLHVWAMSTTEVALTAHLVVPWRETPPAFLAGLEHELKERFGIAHATIQLEALGSDCARTHALADCTLATPEG